MSELTIKGSGFLDTDFDNALKFSEFLLNLSKAGISNLELATSIFKSINGYQVDEKDSDVVVDFEKTVDYIYNKLGAEHTTISLSREEIELVLELETDYLKELGIIDFEE